MYARQFRPDSLEAPDDARPHLRLLRGAPRLRGVPIVRVQLAMIFAAIAVLPFVHRVDNDFWWHLRTGQIIVTSGIPMHDPFSWTMAGRPWVAHEWLSEAIIYVVESMFGYAGNVLLFDGVTFAAMLLMFSLGRRAGAGTRPLVALTLLSGAVLRMFLTVRPQLFSWLLFAVVLALIEEHDAGRPDGPSGKSRVWLLPPLFALWANLHLGVFYGLMLLGCWVAARAWERWRGDAGVDLRAPLAVTAACIIAVSANPHGPALLLYPLRYLLDGHAANAAVAEWQRPDPINIFHWPIFLAALLLVLAVVSRTRPRPFLVLVALATAALSMEAVRNAPFAALVVVPIAGGAMARRWRGASSAADSSVRTPLAAAIALPLLVVALVVPAALAFGDGALSLWTPSAHDYPAAGTAYVRDHLAGRRLLGDYNAAGYEIDKLYPGTKVFIDGRTDFYGNALLEDYLTLTEAKAGWQALLAKYHPDVVMLPDKAPLIVALRADSAWREAFTSPAAVVMVRR